MQKGHIKPIPTKAELIQMYEDKKAQRAADKASKESPSSSQQQHPPEQKWFNRKHYELERNKFLQFVVSKKGEQ